MKRRPARYEQPDLRGSGEELGERRGGRKQVLRIVQEQQRLPRPQMLREAATGIDRLGDRRRDELRILHARERNPEDAVCKGPDELCGHLQREPRLPCSARTRDRHEATAVTEQRDQLRQLLLATEQWARRDGEVRRIERLQRRKLAVADLVETQWQRKILQPMLPQVPESER
jgi:hypothetical protein